MDDTANRMNKIITKALNTSRISRCTHDKYYKDNRSYTYATKPADAECVAYTEMAANQLGALKRMRLVLVMSHNDDDLTMAVHHELAHVRQIEVAQEKGIKVLSPGLSLDEELSKTLVWESHARIIQTEGPLMSFFSDLMRGDTCNVSFYKKHFAASQNNEGAASYMNALLGTQVKASDMARGVDEVGYAFMNDFSRLDADEKQAAVIRARKQTVKDFMHKNVLSNNPTLDGYIGKTIGSYAQWQEKRAASDPAYMMALLSGNGRTITGKTTEPLSMKSILATTEGDYGPCLSEADWFEALDAKNCTELARRNIIGSKHNTAYMQLTKRNTDGNATFGFNY